jgi:2'-hydroxyisoflavone reductase
MNILIIGGTKFVGRYLTYCALERGHQVTLFHRGKTNPDAFPDIEHVHGDRLEVGAFGDLANRNLDAVIDTCGYFPRAVRLSGEAFATFPRYLFISTISVYKDQSKIGLTEEDEVGTIEDESTEEITGESYGPLKALCEKTLLGIFGDRALIVRPGLIIGPHDPTDRFTYWPVRFAKSQTVLAADCKSQPAQQIDVRDLAEWCIGMLEKSASGVYSATGPDSGMTVEEMLEQTRDAVNPDAKIVWAGGNWLGEKKVEAWSDLPMILPFDGSVNGMGAVNVSKAVAAGLTSRPLGETSKDILEWWKGKGSPVLKTGLSDEREAELLGELGVGV